MYKSKENRKCDDSKWVTLTVLWRWKLDIGIMLSDLTEKRKLKSVCVKEWFTELWKDLNLKDPVQATVEVIYRPQNMRMSLYLCQDWLSLTHKL